MHISDLIKRSQVQKGCDFPCATESNQGNTFLSKFQKINMKKLHSAPLVISTKNPNARWKPSNSCLCTYQRTAQGLESYVIPASKRLLKKKKKKNLRHQLFGSRFSTCSVRVKRESKTEATTTSGTKPKPNVECPRVAVDPVLPSIRGKVPLAS